MLTVPIAAAVLLALSAFCGGWLAGHRAGQEANLPLDPAVQQHSIDFTDLGGDYAAIQCECGTYFEMATLAEVLAEHAEHAAQAGELR
jgi:hypothetical protein